MTTDSASGSASSALVCDYCALPMRGRRIDDAPVYCCFGCSVAAQITRSRGEHGRVNEMIARLGAAGFLSMIVMVLAVYLYGEEAYLTGAAATDFSRTLAGMARYAQLLLTAPVLYLLAVPIFQNAVAALRRGVIATDALIVLGVGAAYAYSLISTFRESGATYFETACMILVFVTLGRWFEASGRLKASQAVRSLESLLPDKVAVERDGRRITIRASDARIGDQIRVVAGDRIAVDGVVVAGAAHVDEQLVTGESAPVRKGVGDATTAGTTNLDGTLTIRATASGGESTISRLVALLEDAKRAKGKYELWADRVVSKFVLLTIGVALSGAAFAWRRAGAGDALMTALAVLLIACPCALGIATPMAMWIALGRAARHGVILRGGDALERLALVRTVCFDKTGTLTTGEMQVASFASSATDGDKPLRVAAGLAAGSNHSVARGIVAYARNRDIVAREFEAIDTIDGMGLIASDGDGVVALGSPALMDERSLAFDTEMQTALDDDIANARAVACVGWSGRVRAVVGLTEDLRNDAARVMSRLKSMRFRTIILTGDHAVRASVVSRELGVEARAALRPDDKVNALRAIRGGVAMVGDGLNDAPALAAADVGIAMGCGADITRETGDACLLSNRLDRVPRLLELARRTMRVVRMNLGWSLLYNGVGMGLAVSGRLNPLFAAAAMAGSSLFVVANSLRIGGFSLEAGGDE